VPAAGKTSHLSSHAEAQYDCKADQAINQEHKHCIEDSQTVDSDHYQDSQHQTDSDQKANQGRKAGGAQDDVQQFLGLCHALRLGECSSF
jgi:hypothetical protein